VILTLPLPLNLYLILKNQTKRKLACYAPKYKIRPQFSPVVIPSEVEESLEKNLACAATTCRALRERFLLGAEI